MKKILILLGIILVVMCMSACSDREDSTFLDLSEQDDLDTFLEKVQGYWGLKDSEGNCQILFFDDDKFSDYTYAGHMWIDGGKVTKIAEVADHSFNVVISYNEVAYGEGESQSEEVTYAIKTNDDFRRTLIVGDTEEWSYTFLGMDQESVDNFAIHEQTNNYSTNSSNNNTLNMDSKTGTKSQCLKCERLCEENHLYCTFHECLYSNCRMEKKGGIGIYCVNHSCLLCEREREFDSSYCSSHTCNKCNNVVVEGSMYCVGHKCLLCNYEAIIGGFCSIHD